MPDEVAAAIDEEKLNVVAVLSGNRNFEGRIHPQVRASYLASPLLVVAYALAGRIDLDPTTEPLGEGVDGPVFLRDLWPSPPEIAEVIGSAISEDQFTDQYGRIWEGDERWAALPTPTGPAYEWDPDSTYVREPRSSRTSPAWSATPRRGEPDRGREDPREGRRLDHDGPHLARRAIRPDSPAAPTWSSTVSRSATSTPTAPGAGTTR